MATPGYLQPYMEAAKRFGGGFQSLLWASPKTQAARFEALTRLAMPIGKTIVDAGCGRADLLDFLLARRIVPAMYIGLEAVPALADAAEEKNLANARIVRGDFVSDPALLHQQADFTFFSGSLNTLSKVEFYTTLRAAFNAAHMGVVFNFLSSPLLAAGKHLTWHHPGDVLRFVSQTADDFYVLDDYLEGDCAIFIRKET